MFSFSNHGDVDESFHPSKADMEFRNSVKTKDPFELARMMKSISHEYLSVLAQDNAGPNNAGMKAMIDAEISRRGFAAAANANRIAVGSLVVACISLLIALL